MNVATKEELDRHGYKDPSDDWEQFKKELIRQDREEESSKIPSAGDQG